MAIDDQLNVYALASNQARILKWTPNGAQSVLIDTNTVLMRGLFFHSKSNSLYIGVVNDRSIQKLTLGETKLVKVAFGNGYGSSLNQLKSVDDLFVDDDDNIFVLDSFNARVLKWSPNSNVAVVVAAGGGNGIGLSQLETSVAAAAQFYVDRIQNVLYVADTWNHRIQKYTIGSSNGITVLGGDMKVFSYPRSVLIDGNGNILVGSGSRIIKYRPGENSSGVTIADGIQGSQSTMNEPTNLKFDKFGSLYTIDYQNGRVLKFNVTTSSCLVA